jgi:glycine C-acetyltransferase
LHENTTYFKSGLKNIGFNLSASNHPTILIMIGDEHTAKTASAELLQAGVYCREITHPMVAKGKARLRAQISAAHSKEELDHALTAFADIAKKLKLITY